jgi:hypothetical protein
MQVGNKLEFNCLECNEPITFSLLSPKTCGEILSCTKCRKQYVFDDKTILQHLLQFEALCQQIHDSQDILGNTSVAVEIGSHEVRIPFKILLTRLSSVMQLKIGEENLDIKFRVEPIKDIQEVFKLSKV